MASSLLIASVFIMVGSYSLINLLINFVSHYVLSGIILLIARECGKLIGLSYLIVYTGAVSVLFVFVVLLVENQHLDLAAFASTGQIYSEVFLSTEILEVNSSAPKPVSSLLSHLSSDVTVPSASLASVLYGESVIALTLVGWVLILVTYGLVKALCAFDA